MNTTASVPVQTHTSASPSTAHTNVTMPKPTTETAMPSAYLLHLARRGVGVLGDRRLGCCPPPACPVPPTQTLTAVRIGVPTGRARCSYVHAPPSAVPVADAPGLAPWVWVPTGSGAARLLSRRHRHPLQTPFSGSVAARRVVRVDGPARGSEPASGRERRTRMTGGRPGRATVRLLISPAATTDSRHVRAFPRNSIKHPGNPRRLRSR
jgi:hypothetical protein